MLFTFSPDFNSPPGSDGIRVDSIGAKYAVEAFEEGLVKEGDTAIAFFDPEGDASWLEEFGWSVLVEIVKLEVVNNKLHVWFKEKSELG